MLFDLYVAAPGWLQRLDPRTKLALLVSGAVLLLTVEGALPLAALLAALHLGLRASRVPWARIGWVVSQLRFVLLVILLLFPWIAGVPGRILVEVGPLAVTDASLLAAMETGLRLWGMSLLVTSLLFTTAQPELVRGLVALGLPYEWGLTLTTALRYIPSLARQIEQIQEAQRARGWDAARGDVLKRLSALSPVFVALTIHVFRTVDTLTMAMTARGVGNPGPRTVRRPLRMQTRDWAALVIALLITVLWLVV
ncbi:MAG TPA: energy-coupling factor transporter transmembrane component T [Ardenticatenaceae bacterium]